jgi:hypothetical protein
MTVPAATSDPRSSRMFGSCANHLGNAGGAVREVTTCGEKRQVIRSDRLSCNYGAKTFVREAQASKVAACSMADSS